jgi:hypothetical protein
VDHIEVSACFACALLLDHLDRRGMELARRPRARNFPYVSGSRAETVAPPTSRLRPLEPGKRWHWQRFTIQDDAVRGQRDIAPAHWCLAAFTAPFLRWTGRPLRGGGL